MKIAIMQPYFCAYIGYYQLIKSVDKFIIFDNIQYVKRGWFNRNRVLHNENALLFTIPLKKDSSYKEVKHRYLADNSIIGIKKILVQLQNFYRKAPFYYQIYPFIENLFLQNNKNLFNYIYYSVIELCAILNINTQIIISSSLDIDHKLKAQDKILAICKYFKTDTYINPIGGKDIYDKEIFKREGVDLKFIKSKNIEYNQFDNKFVPSLSIIDVLMFNEIEQVMCYLNEYKFE